jgi:hypothetical protein
MTVYNVGNLYALQNWNKLWDVVDIKANVIANDVSKEEAMQLIGAKS